MKKLISISFFLIFGILTLSAQTFAELKTQAQSGDAEAQYELSERYVGIDDFKNALFWLEKAADGGNVKACFGLSVSYLQGAWGQTINCDKGIQYIIKAAEISNSPEFLVMVANAYLSDDLAKMGCTLIKKDLNEAEKWLRKALAVCNTQTGLSTECVHANTDLGDIYYEKKNYTEAAKLYNNIPHEYLPYSVQNRLGWMYENGLGVPKNTKKAIELYRKAAEQGNEEANDRLEKLTGERVVVPDYNDEPIMIEEENQSIEDEANDLNNKGIEYYNQGNYKEAVNYYRQAAEKGNFYAQSNLAACYQNGEGVAKNIDEAIKWYRKSAEQRYDNAQLQIGYLYETEKQNFTEAAKWYKLAAEQGNDAAQCNFAWCCENGKGVAQNYGEAFKWYSKAAEQGNARGQNGVGWAYEGGNGVTKNLAEAEKWYKLAAAQGLEYAKTNLENLKAKIAAAQQQTQTAEELFKAGEGYYFGFSGYKKNKEEGLKLLLQAAEQGHADAQNRLGYHYEYDDETESLKWFKLAAEQGHAEAQYEVGDYYYNKDKTESLKWYKKSAEQGYCKAQSALGGYYQIIEKDTYEATKWYRKAAENTATDIGSRGCYVIAQEYLGEIYYKEKNYTEALKWLKKAAESNFPDLSSYFLLGNLYAFGYGVSKDETEALKWYRKAAVEGNPEIKNAKHNIDVLERRQQEQYSAKTQQPTQQQQPAQPSQNERAKTKCSNCKGSGHTACRYCGGNYEEVKCTACNGAGEKKCVQCYGKGEKKCSRCFGTGYVDYGSSGRERCGSCSGRGYTKCSFCSGNGSNKCTSCYGRGYNKCDYRECHQGKETCYKCKGAGYVE